MIAPLVHCIYTSRATRPMSAAEIDVLVEHSRAFNGRHGITGILLYVDGCFIQVLEGDSNSVQELYDRIVLDPRHTSVTRIILEAVPRRFFGEWTIGLANIGSLELAHILGFGNAREREALLASIEEGRAKKLLRAFSNGRWHPRLGAVPKLVAA